MGLFDNVKAALGPAKDKVTDLARQHGDKVQGGLDKAAQVVDERTKGKYTDKIHAGTDKAKEAVDRLGQEGQRPGEGTQTPPKS
ncbi:antitoxin [Streptomyces sp. NBC_01171]|uniref:antitoxin n=1 Tax=Streptomyces sp. NBC_01171 TaxID=2903757 RepID=UPI0038686F3B|nr:antitoxin [Streptomyces sp. NBC_01171]